MQIPHFATPSRQKQACWGPRFVRNDKPYKVFVGCGELSPTTDDDGLVTKDEGRRTND